MAPSKQLGITSSYLMFLFQVTSIVILMQSAICSAELTFTSLEEYHCCMQKDWRKKGQKISYN